MKEFVRRWAQRSALDFGARHFLGVEDQPTVPGKIYFQSMVERIKKGEKTPLSEYFGVLHGLKFYIDGLSLLENLKEKGALFLENQTRQGPISGYWKLFATNYFIKKMIGKEIRWIIEQDDQKPQELFRNPIVRSFNAIPVGEGNGTKGVKLILKAFSDQESVGLYPEGQISEQLIKGDPKAGGIILFAASKNIPIISAAAWFEENTCHLSFTLLNNEFIKTMGTSPDKEKKKQQIVDYAMAEIAKNMPGEFRGYYQSFKVPIPAK